MKKQQLLFRNVVNLCDGRRMKLDYSMIECLEDESMSAPYYGIKITKSLDNETDAEEVIGVSYSKEIVMNMIEKMYKNKVTPISMINILDDMITECIT